MGCECGVVPADHSHCMLRSCSALAPGRGRATGSLYRASFGAVAPGRPDPRASKACAWYENAESFRLIILT